MENSSSLASTEMERAPERRARRRMACSYPVWMRGRSEGRRLEARGVAANISSNGVYVFTWQNFDLGDRLVILVRLNDRLDIKNASPQIAASGEVVRIEPQADATCGVALRLERVRLL